MKKNVYKLNKPVSKKTFINKMGIKIAALALALGISSYAFINDGEKASNTIPTIENKAEKQVSKKNLTLALAKSLNENSEIPIFKDNNGDTIIATLNKNTLIISKEKFQSSVQVL